MKKRIDMIFSTLFILSGLYYLISEFVTIYYCSDSYMAYYRHTISELGVPKGQLWYGNVSTFSTMSNVMNLALIINGSLFFFCFLILFFSHLKKAPYILCSILTAIVSIGSIFVGLFHGGNLTRGMHDVGTVMVFAGGNILLLLIGIFFKSKHRLYRLLTIFTGSLGLLSGCMIVFIMNNQYLPILERMAVYPIVFFEIYTGILLLKISINKKRYKDKI